MTAFVGRRFDPAVTVGALVVALSAVIYWLADRGFDAGRGDFFYLADAFLHGRTWLTFQPGPYDVIVIAGRFYVPFAPFPAIVLMPVVAILGATGADQVESGINAILAAGGVMSRPSGASETWTSGISTSVRRPRGSSSRLR